MGNTIKRKLALIIALICLFIPFFTAGKTEAEAPTDVPTGSDTSVLVYVPQAPSTPDVRTFAKTEVIHKWGLDEWENFDRIINKESHWTVSGSHNPSLSTAYGLGGFLDSTWKTVGCVKTSDEYEQVRCTIKYIEQRYGTPTKAWGHHLAKNWY